MTAEQIIEQIKQLDPQEQKRIVLYIYQWDAERRLSGTELSNLAQAFVNTTDEAEAGRIRESIVQGFYGLRKNA